MFVLILHCLRRVSLTNAWRSRVGFRESALPKKKHDQTSKDVCTHRKFRGPLRMVCTKCIIRLLLFLYSLLPSTHQIDPPITQSSLRVHTTIFYPIPMFNAQETLLLEFNSFLTPTHFDITDTRSLEPYLGELKHYGKASEEFDIGDDLLKALGIRIIRNVFTIHNQAIHIYIFITERFPEELPMVFVSDEVRREWKNRYYFENPEEVKKDGKFNLVLIVSKIHNEIGKRNLKVEYLEDYKNLRDSFDPENMLKSMGRIQSSDLLKNKNPSAEEISQQFRMTKDYMGITQYFNQLTMLNDSIINDIRGKHSKREESHHKLLQKGYELELAKKEFAAAFCGVEGIKSRFSKFSIVQFLEEKIEQLNSKAEEIAGRQFSVSNFNQYKAVMREVKKLELKKERISS